MKRTTAFVVLAPIVLPLVIGATTGCEALGIKAKVVTTTSMNGETKTTVREAKNWDEFSTVMGEVATDFSDTAKKVGESTKKLVASLVDVPPPGKVTLADLDPTLKDLNQDPRYDYLSVAGARADGAYDFSYVRLGVHEFDDFFKASAELYATLYQLTETARHIRLLAAEMTGDKGLASFDAKAILKSEIDSSLAKIDQRLAGEAKGEGSAKAAEMANQMKRLWTTSITLATKLGPKAIELGRAGVALAASAPSQIKNPKLLLHIKLIVKGIGQSVALVKDAGPQLAKAAGLVSDTRTASR